MTTLSFHKYTTRLHLGWAPRNLLGPFASPCDKFLIAPFRQLLLFWDFDWIIFILYWIGSGLPLCFFHWPCADTNAELLYPGSGQCCTLQDWLADVDWAFAVPLKLHNKLSIRITSSDLLCNEGHLDVAPILAPQRRIRTHCRSIKPTFSFHFITHLLAFSALVWHFTFWFWHFFTLVQVQEQSWIFSTGPSLSANYRSKIRRPGPKSRHSSARQVRRPRFGLLPVLLMSTTLQSYWGEGCDPSMGITEVPSGCPDSILFGTKRHGMQPTACHGTPIGQETANPHCNRVVKRSLQRAHRRAVFLGHAWYKGRSYVPGDFERMGCKRLEPAAKPLPNSLQNDWQKCHSHHSQKRRLTAWHWNCGGLSAAKLDEVAAWLHMNSIHIAVISETRWCFDSEWTDKH